MNYKITIKRASGKIITIVQTVLPSALAINALLVEGSEITIALTNETPA